MIKVKRALISVSDKSGLVEFAKGLKGLGIEILSTGGTAKALTNAGLKAVEVSEYTGFPEMLDGRVKTLHPMIHGGLLAVRDNPEHMEQIKKYNIGLIDMVVVNLYPFEKVIEKKNVSNEEAIENIDIGGPAMLRSAAKNFKNVAVICNPGRYKDILKELDQNSGILSDAVLINLAIEAFEHTARYDGIIHNFLNSRLKTADLSHLPKELTLRLLKIQDLRYGENPHQTAAFYRQADGVGGLAKAKQLHGKELSFNNILDLHAAVDCLKEFEQPAAIVIKHGNPTGIAEDKSLTRAYEFAFEADSLSAFGGIIGINREVDFKTARLIVKSGFMECVIAPSYDKEAFGLLSQKKNVRLMEFDFNDIKDKELDFKTVHGGILVQDRDTKKLETRQLKVITKIQPTKEQLASLLFAWKVVKNVKSNAIVLAKQTHAVGIGCGHTSRVGAAAVAIEKAGKQVKGSVLASDAFLPKADTVKIAAKAGVKAIIQPGGSIADEEVIKEANKAKIAMVFSGIRHFKH